MKAIFPALCCAAVLFLSACSPSPAPTTTPPTEAEVEQAYLTAEEVYGWFHLSALPTQGEAVTEDGAEFFPVVYNGLSSYADLEKKVRSLFSKELADQLLSDGQYRDIDGKFHCTGGARGQNIYLKGRTLALSPSGENAWDVTLRFYADSWDFERPRVTIGYSQTVLRYESTADGWRFTSFCPADDLDLEAETVFRFTYELETFDATDFEEYSDLQLALYLLHSDGAYSEWPSDLFSRRFLSSTAGVMDVLAIVSESPWENKDTVVSSPASSAAAWFPPELLPDFEAALAGYAPKNESERAVLQKLSDTFDERLTQTGDGGSLSEEFGFVLSGGAPLFLGTQAGDFPWGYDLSGTPQAVEGDDFGQGYTVDCGSFQLYYTTVSDGTDWLTRLSTTRPYTDPDCVYTPRGLYCGSTLAHVQHSYPKAVSLEAEGYDAMYVYEEGSMHIAFYILEDIVVKIEVENLIDGTLLQ